MRIVVTRGPADESEHRVNGVVADGDGPIAWWGDPDRAVIPRSAIKFAQAIPLLRTGAAEAYQVTDTEVVLACSSHSGEAAHVEAVRAWLDRIGLDESALECGPDEPIGGAGDRKGLVPKPIYNCCSGKHTGFLTVARHLGFDHRGYIEPDHPVQRLVTEAVADLTGVDLSGQKPGRDGCAIPTFAFPLRSLAGAMAELVSLAAGSASAGSASAGSATADEPSASGTDVAVRRIVEANQGRQFWISGTGRHEVFLGQAIDEPLLVKAGAEGVYMAALPERGLGMAIKVEDGASRAAEVAISAVLASVGALDDQQVAKDVTNKPGDVVGRLYAAETDPEGSIDR